MKIEEEKEVKKDKRFWSKKKIIFFIIFVTFFCGIILFFYFQIRPYSSKVLPNFYLDKQSLKDVNFHSLDFIIQSYEENVLSQEIIFLCNDKEYVYTYRDLGLGLDEKKIRKDIITYQKDLSFFEKYSFFLGDKKHVFSYSFSIEEDGLKNFLTKLKSTVDQKKVNGSFSMDNQRNLKYTKGIDGYSLDVEKSLSILLKELKQPKENQKIVLEGKTTPATNNDQYQTIDTKVSSFKTEFNSYIVRATNLKVALNYIDGAIVMPGEVFSFYKYAGPYNKSGYVFYYEFVGNGVCQIATTVYNAALLGGLEIVRRYPHKAKSPYVPGGLDATVASYSSGWNVDFQFKNTYKYPIYISAYAVGGEAHVDFWSNKDAMGGKTYSTESVQIGTRGYTTYLHTYQDGVEISRKKIATTWYSED